MDIGDPTYSCTFCGALMWFDERIKRFKGRHSPSFSLCCSMGKINLKQLEGPPAYLQSLMYGNESDEAKMFRDNIRIYNTMFSFTSMGGRIDKSINTGGAPHVFRLNGQNHHRIGTLLPLEGHSPRFAQLYVYDTANEVTNRIQAVRYLKSLSQLLINEYTVFI